MYGATDWRFSASVMPVRRFELVLGEFVACESHDEDVEGADDARCRFHVQAQLRY